MAAYIIADVKVSNEQQMVQYRQLATRAMHEHGAEVVVRGGAIEPLEGDWSPKRVVVLKFKDHAAARAYYDSATYTQARQLREGAGSINMIIADGVN